RAEALATNARGALRSSRALDASARPPLGDCTRGVTFSCATFAARWPYTGVMAEADRDRTWLEKEPEKLRARESERRQRGGREAALGARLHGYVQSMHEMFRSRPPSSDDLERTLVRVARLSAEALAIRRTSVWRFDPGETRLTCIIQLLDQEEIAPTGLVI